MDPQETMMAVRKVLQAQGLPMTTENLTRGMQMVSAAQDAIASGKTPEEAQQIAQQAGRAATPMDAAMDHVMQESPAQARAARPAIALTTRPAQTPVPTSTQVAPPVIVPPVAPAEVPAPVAPPPGPMPEPAAPQTTDEPEAVRGWDEEQAETRGGQIAAGMPPGGRRAGTINGAQRIADDYGNEGNVMDPHHVGEGTQPRQADETGVNQYGLAAGLLAPFALATPAAAMVGRAGAAGASSLQRMMMALRSNGAPNVKPQYGPPANGQRVGTEQFGPPQAGYGPPNLGQRVGNTQHGPPRPPQYGPNAPTLRERLLNRETAIRNGENPAAAWEKIQQRGHAAKYNQRLTQEVRGGR